VLILLASLGFLLTFRIRSHAHHQASN
jgi:hypothetical protein